MKNKRAMKKKLQALTPRYTKVCPEVLHCMPYEHPGKAIDVTIETGEFTCLCPWSGLPDFARLTVRYMPEKYVLELKSLKYYLHSYRQVGMVHESVVNSILDDLVKACAPAAMTVELVFGVRGGIQTTVKAEYKKHV